MTNDLTVNNKYMQHYDDKSLILEIPKNSFGFQECIQSYLNDGWILDGGMYFSESTEKTIVKLKKL